MIHLIDFDEYSRDDIRVEVAPHLVHSSIKVVLPKAGPIYLTARETLIDDYGIAAYAGYLFGEYAPNTTYEFATLHQDGDFIFTVPLNDFEKFIDVLETLSYGFGSGDEDDQFSFREDVEQFADEVKSGKIKALSPDIVATYWELVNSLEQLDDE